MSILVIVPGFHQKIFKGFSTVKAFILPTEEKEVFIIHILQRRTWLGDLLYVMQKFCGRVES